MYAHKVPQFYLKKWVNDSGKSSVYFYDKIKDSYLSNNKNISNIFGESSYYYFELFKYANKKVDGSLSGAHMFIIQKLYYFFKDFFTDVDDKIFLNYKLFINDIEIINNKTYDFTYNYYSQENIKVYSGDLLFSNSKMRDIIEKEWLSNKYREYNEEKLSSLESKYKESLDKIIDKLLLNDKDKLESVHFDMAQIISLQQSRMPNDILTKEAIDKAVATINDSVMKFNRNDLTMNYIDDDYRDICMIQLLKFFNNDKDSVYKSLLDIYNSSSFIYLKASKSHKFVVGDNPVVVISENEKKYAICFPICPDYCVLYVRGLDSKYDTIVKTL